MDEFSAVSRRLPIWQLYERARSLGLAVQVSAQSWEGLAGTEDERHRIAATAEGGIWVLRTPRPDPLVALAGTQPAVDTTRRFEGAGAWSDDGLSRTRLAPVLDGDLVRRLDVGQVAYIYRGGVTFLQIKRLTGRQAATGRGSEPATIPLPVVAAVPGMAAVPGGWPAPGMAGAPRPGVRTAAGAGAAAGVAGAAAMAANVPVSGAVGGPPWAPVPRAASGIPDSAMPGMAGMPGGIALGGMELPDVSEVLDEAFGARRD